MTVKAGRIRVSSGYMPIAVLCVCAALFEEKFPASLLCTVIHETGHIAMLLLFGANEIDIKLGFMCFDIIDRKDTVRPQRQDVLITLFGPLANLICVPVFFYLNALFHFKFFADCAVMSLALCFFNMLPINSTDGGALLHTALCRKFGIDTADRALNISSAIMLLPLCTAAFFIFLRTRRNFTLLLAALCLLI